MQAQKYMYTYSMVWWYAGTEIYIYIQYVGMQAQKYICRPECICKHVPMYEFIKTLHVRVQILTHF